MLTATKQFFSSLAIVLLVNFASLSGAQGGDTNYRLSSDGYGSRINVGRSAADSNKPDTERIFIDDNGKDLPKVHHGRSVTGGDSGSMLEVEGSTGGEDPEDKPSDSGAAETDSSGETQSAAGEPSAPAVQDEPSGRDDAAVSESTLTQEQKSGSGSPDADDAPWVEVTPTPTNVEVEKKARAKKRKSMKAARQKPSAKSDPAPKKEDVRPDREEALLSRLVRELEFGTLTNSIELLKGLTTAYPEDPDYTSLLALALRLRDGDVWYSYQRKVDGQRREAEAVKAPPPKEIFKPTPSEAVNELKRSSWFLIRSVKR